MINNLKVTVIIILITIALFTRISFCQDHISYGKYISYKDIKKIEKCKNKIDITFKLGNPNIIFKKKKNDIWIYYFIDDTQKKNRIVIRYISITFENKKNLLKSVEIFY